MNFRGGRLLVAAYLIVAGIAVGVGGLLMWLQLSPGAPAGTITVLAAARVTERLAPAPVRVHSASSWIELSHSAGGAVPVAPESLTLAQARVPAATYDLLEVGGVRVPVTVDVAGGRVQPVLVEVSGGRPNVYGVYAGSQDVSLGINELAGRLTPLPDFHLVDQEGRPFDRSSIAGRDVVFAAFHTTCHTTCPLYTGLFLQLQNRLPASAALVEVTTDPATDTPDVLRAYAASIDAHWAFATGDSTAVAAFWKTFSVELSNGESHSSTVAVVDRHGFLRPVYQGVPRLDQPLAPQLRSQLNAAGQAQLASGGDGWGMSQILDALHTIDSQIESSTAAGGPAPGFSLSDPSGRPIQLSQFKGRPVVLNFWATWCDPCRRELPLLQRSLAGVAAPAAVLVDEGDAASPARAFTSGLGVTLPVALDADGRVGVSYKVGGVLPTTYFVKADGTIEGRYVGELDGTVLATHLAALRAG